jgi:hypothetical protein
MQNLEQEIRERAYYLWIADGSPEGNADAYWLAAQREVLATSFGSATVQPGAAVAVSETRTNVPTHHASTVSSKKRKRRAA